MSLLDDANLIISERQQAYHEIIADLYFMALLDNNYEEAYEIWRDAQLFDSFFLFTAIANARQQASSLTHPSRSRAIPQCSPSRAWRRRCFRPPYCSRRHR